MLLETIWLSTTSLMIDERCKECFVTINDFMKKFKPTKVINNTAKMDFSIHPEFQEWIDQLITPTTIEVGLKKMAFVMSENFTAQVGIEQAIEEMTNPIFTTRYFGSIAEAKTWILADSI